MSRPQTATWNREDRDLLVELRTTMFGMNGEISALRGEVKEINTGITSRLLNLESNSLSKVEVNPKLEELDQRITGLEDSRIEYRATMEARTTMVGWLNAGITFAITVVGF